MTVLFAAALRDCAVIGADSFRTALDGQSITNFDKTRLIAPTVAVASFGYGGPATDDALSKLASEFGTGGAPIERVLSRASVLAMPIYEERRSYFAEHGQGDYGLTFLFACWDDERGSSIHWVDCKTGGGVPESAWYRPSGTPKLVGQGAHGVQGVVRAAFSRSGVLHDGLPQLDAERWASRVITDMRPLTSEHLGFPAHLCVVGSASAGHYTVPELAPGGRLLLVA